MSMHAGVVVSQLEVLTSYNTLFLVSGCWLQLGSTAIGVLTKEGVVLAVEKRITSPLLVGLLIWSPSSLGLVYQYLCACIRAQGRSWCIQDTRSQAAAYACHNSLLTVNQCAVGNCQRA